MGSLVKQFSIVGIIAQVIWALLLFSSFGVQRVLSDFGVLGPYLVGALSLATLVGWLVLVGFLFSNDEIESKGLWFVSLFFLPGQFIFWIKFIQNSDAIQEMNEPTFNRESFLEEYDVVEEPVLSPQEAFVPKTRKRGLTPPVFMALDRKSDDSRPQL